MVYPTPAIRRPERSRNFATCLTVQSAPESGSCWAVLTRWVFELRSDQVRDLRVVLAGPCDEAELGREDPDPGLTRDPEEVLGVGVVLMNPLAVEVVVEVLDLVARKEHQPSAVVGDQPVVLDVGLARLRRDVGGNEDRVRSHDYQSYQKQ